MVSDVFSRLVGQARAAQKMRHYVASPVHAYLFRGPAGSNLHDAALVFAAALQCPENGCGACDVCRQVLEGHEADTTTMERQGLSWRIEEIHEAERISRRRPLRDGYQIVILEDIELAAGAGTNTVPALLKTLEEPPTRTIFLLTASEVTDDLATIVSRCVDVMLAPLSEEDVTAVLLSEGASPEAALLAAQSAMGSVARARVLVRDPALRDRLALWRSLPDRLNGSGHAATAAAAEITAAITAAEAPLVELQKEEMARLAADAKALGLRAVPRRKEIEADHKRALRRLYVEEVRFGLLALSAIYRNQVVANAGDTDTTSRQRAVSALTALEIINETFQRVATNVNDSLLLLDLLLGLSRV